MFQQVHKTNHKFPDDSSTTCGSDTVVVRSDGNGPCLSQNVQLFIGGQSHRLLRKLNIIGDLSNSFIQNNSLIQKLNLYSGIYSFIFLNTDS